MRCGGYKKQQGFHGLCLQYGDPRRFCLTGSSFVLMSWEGGFLILVAIVNSLRASWHESCLKPVDNPVIRSSPSIPMTTNMWFKILSATNGHSIGWVYLCSSPFLFSGAFPFHQLRTWPWPTTQKVIGTSAFWATRKRSQKAARKLNMISYSETTGNWWVSTVRKCEKDIKIHRNIHELQANVQ